LSPLQAVLKSPNARDVFTSDVNSGIEYTLSKFADVTNLSGAADKTEGRDAIQMDLDRLERWANNTWFNKAKCMVLHPGQGKTKNEYRLGNKWIKSCPAEKDFVVFVDEKLVVIHLCVCLQSRKPVILLTSSKEMQLAGLGR